MPGDILRPRAILAEEVRGKQQDVRADQALDTVQHARPRRQVPDKGRVEMPVQQPDLRRLPADFRFEQIELTPNLYRLRLLHDPDAGQKPVRTISRNFRLSQSHCRASSSPTRLMSFARSPARPLARSPTHPLTRPLTRSPARSPALYFQFSSQSPVSNRSSTSGEDGVAG